MGKSSWRIVCLGLLLLAACSGPRPAGTRLPPAAGPGQPSPVAPLQTGLPDAERIRPAASPAVQRSPGAEEVLAARPTPTPWFPLTRFVAPSGLPYDPGETIWMVPVYACPGQSCLWLGDLPAGQEVRVTAFSEDLQDCFVAGTSLQGWAVEGWVSCSRLADAPGAEGP